MKKIRLLVAIILIASNQYTYCQQIEEINLPDNKEYKPLIPTGEMKIVLDSLFPGATYEFGATKDKMQRNGCIVNIIKDDRKEGIGPSNLLNTQIRFIDKSNTSDTGFIYSPVSIVKAFVYFDVIYGQDKYFDNDLAPYSIKNDLNPVVVNETNLTVSRIFEDFSNDWSSKYSAMDSSDRFLNYRAVVKLNPNRYYQFFGSKWLQADEIVYNFQISDGIIMGYQFFLSYNSEKVFDSKYRSLANHSNKIYKGYFDNRFNQKKRELN